MPSLQPSAYAPYRDPRDYILSWTDEIWVNLAIGRLAEHYGPGVKVHTAYGETYDFDAVIGNSVQKFSAFPDAGAGLGEDVIWEQRGTNGFISSHRLLKTGTHSGYSGYGAPTSRSFVSRSIAHCLVQDNLIVEEWLVRDEYAILEALGLDPHAAAAALARRSPVTGQAVAAAPEGGAFAGRIADPAVRGISGPRPPHGAAACEMVAAYFQDVWNGRRFDLAKRYVSERVVCQSVRMRRVQTLQPYQMAIIDLLATFPDAKVEIRDFAVNESDELGTRVAVFWVLRGTYCGVPTYGPPTDSRVHILGASHLEIRDGKILREWRLYDEIAVMAQIIAARGEATSTTPS